MPLNKNLSAAEVIDLTRVLYNTLKMMTEAESLAGVILTNDTYETVRDAFWPTAQPHNPTGGFIADPRMNDIFVVDGLLIMRGTQLQ